MSIQPSMSQAERQAIRARYPHLTDEDVVFLSGRALEGDTTPELQFSGVVFTPRTGGGAWENSIATAGDYARYAAAAMNAASADDTDFFADGATVTAYVHCVSHMSATFAPDEGRPYPGEES